jgi:NTE family protein
VGVAWEAGLIVGLAQEGVDLSAADMVAGTSAGSIVGCHLRRGEDLASAVELLAQAVASQPKASPEAIGSSMETLMAELARITASAASSEEVITRMGRVALESETMSEDEYLLLFTYLSDVKWPEGFRATAVDTENGQFTVWDGSAGEDLQRAVASSCAVPGVFPPVTIARRRYMDGGMRTPLNADLAAGHDAAVVVSCFPLSLPEGLSDPMFEALVAQMQSELDSVRRSGARVGVVAPGEEFLDISGWGLHLMDASRSPAAFEAGRRQAVSEAPQLGPVWAP